MVKRPKLLFLVTEDWYFCSHRLPIAREAQRQGYEVVVAARTDRHAAEITSHGFKLIPLKMQRRSAHPVREFRAIMEIAGIYRREKPDIVHHVAMKPVLYGSLAARLAGVPRVVNALAGMGYVFISGEWKARLLRPAIRTAFRFLLNRGSSVLILQNSDDGSMFVGSRLIDRDRIRLVRGSGVDTDRYREMAEPGGAPVVVLTSRMLWDKGVGEFVAAARLLHERGVQASFVLVGDTDPQNPAAIDGAQLSAWHEEGKVSWWGRREDMPEVLEQSHLVCLPSYREGLPKSLLEAASSGRPIVTTDTTGCRDVVRHGDNGLLVPVRSTVELADALQLLIEEPGLRKKMGERGREIVLQQFTEQKVVAETLAVYEELLQT